MSFIWNKEHITPGKRFRLIGVPEEMMIVYDGFHDSEYSWYVINLSHGGFLDVRAYYKHLMADKLTKMGATPV